MVSGKQAKLLKGDDTRGKCFAFFCMVAAIVLCCVSMVGSGQAHCFDSIQFKPGSVAEHTDVFMLNFPPKVLRWEKLALQELTRGNYPLPVELVLALIWVESRGETGAKNQTSGASGLMQVMPDTLKDYNKAHKIKISLDELRSTNDRDAEAQIKTGLWCYGQFLKSAYRWIIEKEPRPELADLIKIADLFYVAGPGRIRQKFGKVSPRNFGAFVASAPDWKHFKHPLNVWKLTAIDNDPVWDVPGIESWVKGKTGPSKEVLPPKIAARDGFLLALSILSLASWYLSKHHDT
jgi:hypothetical protein